MDFMALLRQEKKRAITRRKGNSVDDDVSSHLTAPCEKTAESMINFCHSISPLQSTKSRRLDFDASRLGHVDNIWYFSSVIDSEESYRLSNILESYSEDTWVQIRTRKLQCWGEVPSTDAGTVPSSSKRDIPEWLNSIVEMLINLTVFDDIGRPNNILINSYTKDQGIIHHVDGPKYYERVAILSLGAPCLMTFRKRLDPSQIGIEYGGDLFSVVLEPNSLLVFSESIYTDYMHGIASGVAAESVDFKGVNCLNKHIVGIASGDIINRGARISLTFRRVVEDSTSALNVS